jgi:hypothetical protein
VEGESQGRVRELAPQRFVRGIRRPKPLSRGDSRTRNDRPLRSACQTEEAARHSSKGR